MWRVTERMEKEVRRSPDGELRELSIKCPFIHLLFHFDLTLLTGFLSLLTLHYILYISYYFHIYWFYILYIS